MLGGWGGFVWYAGREGGREGGRERERELYSWGLGWFYSLGSGWFCGKGGGGKCGWGLGHEWDGGGVSVEVRAESGAVVRLGQVGLDQPGGVGFPHYRLTADGVTQLSCHVILLPCHVTPLPCQRRSWGPRGAAQRQKADCGAADAHTRLYACHAALREVRGSFAR